jgi:DNA-binding IclR family transcriptional regulator
MPHEEEAIDGDEDRGPAIQSIARAAAVLRALEAGGSDGRTLTAVARDTGFAKGTTHRLLQALTEIGFVYQDLGTRCYRLGAALGLLSRHAFQQDIASLARPALQRLAAASGDTIYLSVPEGSSSVCIDRELGAFPIRNLSLDVGQLRPLGVGSGSLALLAFMPADEIEVIIARNAVWLHVRQTQSQGFSYVDGLIIPGVNAVGVPIFDADRRPTAALSITAIAVRISGDRTVEMVNLLNTEARRLSEQLVTAGGRISD